MTPPGKASGAAFLDSGLDFSTDSFEPEEKAALLAWYRDVHDYKDLDLAPFARFVVEHDAGGFKRLRRHVMRLEDAHDGVSLPTVAGVLMYVHTYVAIANGKGALYEVIAARALGASKAQALETMRLGAQYGGPAGMNPLGELALEYLDEWDGGEASTIEWPEGWAPDPAAFRSGIDPASVELSGEELELARDWYRRMFGEVPRHVDRLAALHPTAFKTHLVRFEFAPVTALPAQIVPLFRLHLAALRQWPQAARRATQMAKSLGVRRHHVVSTLFWAAVYGGDPVLETAMTAIDDLLDDFD
jgi:alkylhydroperoxidase/carboxymuconolactone decarboxylase family protein YurZ